MTDTNKMTEKTVFPIIDADCVVPIIQFEVIFITRVDDFDGFATGRAAFRWIGPNR